MLTCTHSVDLSYYFRYGCKALENLAVRTMHQRVIVAKANAVQIMLKGMKAHIDDVEVQSFGCHALAVMSGDDLVMHEHITQMSGAIYMLDQLKTHSSSADFTANVCRLLANLSLHDKVRAYLIKQHALPAIIRGIKEHSSDTDVNHFGFSALSNFANDTKLRPMIAKEITALVHKTLHTMHSDPDVQISGVTLLERISFNANQQVLVGERSVKLMVKVLEGYVALMARPLRIYVTSRTLMGWANFPGLVGGLCTPSVSARFGTKLLHAC